MLLDLKTVGWGPANRPTNRRIDLFADWLEAQAYVAGSGSAISKNEVEDRLEGTSLVLDSDDAWALVGDAFAACRSRNLQLGTSYPFEVAADSIELRSSSSSAYLFCLLVSLPEQLTGLRSAFSTEFRDIFEDVVAEAMREALPKWDVYSTGWSSIASSAGKGAIVGKVGGWVAAKHWDDSVFPNANDGQVDIAAVRTFGDSRSAFPVILGQCATGVTDWKQKASRPNLDRWTLAVQFSHLPSKLFAVPFALDDASFWEATVESRGLVLDRNRLCSALTNMSSTLGAKIDGWIATNRSLLPTAA